MIGTIMTVPIRPIAAGSGRAGTGRASAVRGSAGWAGQAGAIDAHALADLLGRWPAADGPLYPLLAKPRPFNFLLKLARDRLEGA